MKKIKQRKTIQVYTRKIRRAIAKQNMRKEGITKLNKPNPKSKKSIFAELWRKYVKQ